MIQHDSLVVHRSAELVDNVSVAFIAVFTKMLHESSFRYFGCMLRNPLGFLLLVSCCRYCCQPLNLHYVLAFGTILLCVELLHGTWCDKRGLVPFSVSISHVEMIVEIL